MTSDEREKRLRADFYRRTVIENPWIPVSPFPRQQAFLSETATECLYGGAAGGGKSVGILAAALQLANEPGYSALLLRRTFRDLNQPKALIPLSHEWLRGTRARWDSRAFRWYLPNDVTIGFGYLDNANDIYQYQGAAYQFIGFDELTQFLEGQYTYLFSRLRKAAGMNVLLRMRATSNPGGVGHEWVRQRFIEEGRPFVPARLENNPGLDRESYEAQLRRLDPVTQAQLRNGDWAIQPEGNLFKREWFADKVDDNPPRHFVKVVRFWDLAATEERPGTDPDFTAGVLMGVDDRGTFWVLDVQEFRASPAEVESRVSATARIDGADEVEVLIEQEPGASGKSLIDHYQRRVLPGHRVFAVRANGDKITRAQPFSAACQNGLVRLVRGSWVGRFIDRLTGFGLPGVHDDVTDAASGAHRGLTVGYRKWTEDDWRTVMTRTGPKKLTPREMLLQRVRGNGKPVKY